MRFLRRNKLELFEGENQFSRALRRALVEIKRKEELMAYERAYLKSETSKAKAESIERYKAGLRARNVDREVFKESVRTFTEEALNG